jgi:hypothetical protein
MRRYAVRALGDHPACHIVDGRGEATTLPDGSVDLIAVAQAIHWCDPHPTRAEFTRIAAPGCWLALLRNRGTNAELGAALSQIYPPESDTEVAMVGKREPRSYYYPGDYQVQTYPFATRNIWETFLGALSTASSAPDEDSPLYAEFARGARRVFERYSVGGVLESHGETELWLGRIGREGG